MTRSEEIQMMLHGLTDNPYEIVCEEHYTKQIVQHYGLSVEEARGYAKDICRLLEEREI